MGHAQPANVPVDTLLEQSVTVPNIFEKELFCFHHKETTRPRTNYNIRIENFGNRNEDHLQRIRDSKQGTKSLI